MIIMFYQCPYKLNRGEPVATYNLCVKLCVCHFFKWLWSTGEADNTFSTTQVQQEHLKLCDAGTAFIKSLCGVWCRGSHHIESQRRLLWTITNDLIQAWLCRLSCWNSVYKCRCHTSGKCSPANVSPVQLKCVQMCRQLAVAAAQRVVAAGLYRGYVTVTECARDKIRVGTVRHLCGIS